MNLRDPWGTTATQEPAVGQSTEPDYNGQTPTTSNDANSYREAGGYGGHQEIPGPLPGRDGAVGGGPSQNAPDVGNPLGAAGEIMIGADQGIGESIGESLEGIGNFAADPIGSITRLDADLTDAAAGIARELYDDGPTAAGNSLGEAIGKAASDLYNEASTNNGAGNLFGRGLVEIAKVLVGAGVARAASAAAEKVGDLTAAAKVADKADAKDKGKKGDTADKGDGKTKKTDKEKPTVVKGAPDDSEKRVTNDKHHQNSQSPEPKNVDELWQNSIQDSEGTRWVKDSAGTVHRFSPPRNGESHWNGSTDGPKPIRYSDIPPDVKRDLGVKR